MDVDQILLAVKNEGLCHIVHLVEYFELQKDDQSVEISNVLRTLRYISNGLKLAKSLTDAELVNLKGLTKRCCHLVKSSRNKNTAGEDTTPERALCNIVYSLKQLDQFDAELEVAKDLHEILVDLRAKNDFKLTENITTVIQSCHYSLWNSAGKLDKVEVNVDETIPLALKLRLQAIKYLILDDSSDFLERLKSKVANSAQAYLYFSHFHKIDLVPSILNEFYYDTVDSLSSQRRNDNGTYCDAFVSTLLEIQDSQLKNVGKVGKLKSEWVSIANFWLGKSFVGKKSINGWSKISKFISKLADDALLSISDVKCVEKSLTNLTKTSGSIKKHYYELLSAVQLFVSFLKFNMDDVIKNVDESKIEMVVGAKNLLMSIVRLTKNISGANNEISWVDKLCSSLIYDAFSCLVNLYKTFTSKFADEKVLSSLSEHVAEICKAVSSYLSDLLPSSNNFASYKYFANELARIGTIYYNMYLYSDAVPIFSCSCSCKKKWIESLESSSSEEKVKSLCQSYNMLAYCQRKAGDLKSSLCTLLTCMQMDPECVASYMKRWVRVKYDAANNNENFVNWTVKKVMDESEQKVENKEDVVKMLEAELDSMKIQVYDTSDECYYIVCDLFDVTEDDSLSRARALIELSHLLWKKMYDADCSAVESCKQAINILQSLERTESKGCNAISYYLGLAYFWLYMVELQDIQSKSEKEIESIQVIPLDKNEDSPSQKDQEQDENDVCDVTPSYSSISLDQEMKSMESVDKCLIIWSTLLEQDNNMNVDGLSYDEKLNWLEVLKAMAEIYGCASRIKEEMKSWNLVVEIASSIDERVEQIHAISRVVRCLCSLNYINEAECLLNVAKVLVVQHLSNVTADSSSADKISYFTYLLATADYHMRTFQFDEGMKILKLILENQMMSLQNKQAQIIQADAYLLLGQFFTVNGYSTNSNVSEFHMAESLPIFLCTKAVDATVWLVKTVNEEQNSNSKKASLGFRHRAVNLLITSCITVGKMYVTAGAIREARCYLKEGLAVSQKQALALRTIETLITMATADLICEMTSDCEVKLSGIKSILLMKSPSNAGNCGDQSPNSPHRRVNSDDEDFLVTQPGRKANIPLVLRDRSEINSMASPLFKQRPFDEDRDFPSFVSHSDRCGCSLCDHHLLHRAFVDYNLLNAECLNLQKMHGSAVDLFVSVKSLCKRFSNRGNFRDISFRSVKRVGVCRTFDFSARLCSARSKLVDVYTNLSNYTACLSELKKAFTDFESLDKYAKSANFLIYSNLKYQHCLVSLGMLAERESISVSKLFDPFWSTLPKSSTGQSGEDSNVEKQNLLLLSPYRTPCHNFGKRSAKLPSKVKRCRAPVKKIDSLFVDEESDDILNIAILDFSDEDSNGCKDNSPLKSEFGKSVSKTKVASEISTTPKLQNPIKESLNSAEIKDKFGEDALAPKQKKSTSPEDKKRKKIRNLKFKSPVSNSAETGSRIGKSILKKTGSDNSRRITRRKFVQIDTELLRNGDIEQSPELNAVWSPQVCVDESVKVTEEMPSPGVRHLSVKPKTTTVRFTRFQKKYGSEVSRAAKAGAKSKNAKPKVRRRKKFDVFEDDELETSRRVSTIREPLNDAIQPVDEERSRLSSSTTSRRLLQLESPVLPSSSASQDLGMDDIRTTLEEIEESLRCNPPVPLYPEICSLLALCRGDEVDDVLQTSSSYLCRGTSVTLRHISLVTIVRKLWKQQKKMSTIQNSSPINDQNLNMEEVLLQDPRLNILAFGNKGNSLDNLVSSIPTSWSVVQVNSIKDSGRIKDLLITKYNCNRRPITMKIRTSSPENENFGFVDKNPDLVTEFGSILDDSGMSHKSTDKKQWWKQRINLDSRMKNISDGLENIWLRHWKGLFLGIPSHDDDRRRLKQAVENVVAVCNDLSIENVNVTLLEVIVDSYPWLSSEQLDDAVSFVTRLNRTQSKHRQMCQTVKQQAKNVNSCLFPRDTVILILDKNVESLCWESMPIIRNQSSTRMPSLHFLIAHLRLLSSSEENVYKDGVDVENVYYVLNPSGDLNFTQQFFIDYFIRAGWSGVSGREPTSQEFTSGLTDNSLFIYCGHGCGGSYLAGEYIRKLDCRAVVLLIGCSSAKLKCLGSRLEPVGMVHQYLIAGCPSLVGNLWDITDRDIDAFLDEMLQRWLLKWRQMKELDGISGNVTPHRLLTSSLSQSRDACKLKHMIGSAPVIYGFPTFCR